MIFHHRTKQHVFSAHAEVVPSFETSPHCEWGILRARGGSSRKKLTDEEKKAYSPRTRR